MDGIESIQWHGILDNLKSSGRRIRGSLKTGKLVPLPPLPVDTEKVRYSANYLLIRRKLVNEIHKFA